VLVLVCVSIPVLRALLIEVTSSRVVGTVVQAATGRPVAGAIVVAARRAAGGESASPRRAQISETRSDPNGQFDLRLVSRGAALGLSNSYVLIALAPGYQPLIDEDLEPDTGRGTFQLQPLGELAPDSGRRAVAERVARLYSGVQFGCIATEIPRLAGALAESGAPMRNTNQTDAQDAKHACEE
jgi:hypothetical protein